VNLDFVREMTPLESGDYEITMRDSKKLRMSRKYRACLQTLLRDSFLSEADKPLR
jgi:DNA-binding LytR/AlgR family response regulator